jgi:hypothetical protein
MGVNFRSGLKMATTGWVRIPFLPVWPFLEVFYPDDLPLQMNLHLLYYPLDPTSNGEGVHPGKMLLDDSLLAVSHNQSGSAYSVLVGHSEKAEGVSELQQQTNLAPAKDFIVR